MTRSELKMYRKKFSQLEKSILEEIANIKGCFLLSKFGVVPPKSVEESSKEFPVHDLQTSKERLQEYMNECNKLIDEVTQSMS